HYHHRAPHSFPTRRSSDLMDLAFLRNMDLTGKINVGQLKVQEVEASDFHASLRAIDGKLQISDIKAQLYDGSLAGQLSATADNADRKSTRLNSSHVKISYA